MKKNFTLYWLDGKKETVTGENIASAMTLAGYGNGAVRALDFYAEEDSDEYKWNKQERKWIKRAMKTSDFKEGVLFKYTNENNSQLKHLAGITQKIICLREQFGMIYVVTNISEFGLHSEYTDDCEMI